MNVLWKSKTVNIKHLAIGKSKTVAFHLQPNQGIDLTQVVKSVKVSCGCLRYYKVFPDKIDVTMSVSKFPKHLKTDSYKSNKFLDVYYQDGTHIRLTINAYVHKVTN